MLKRHYNALRKIFLVLTAVFLTVGVALGLAVRENKRTVFAQTPTVISEEISSVYVKNTFAEFPQSVYVAYGTNSAIPAEFLGIRMPDGSVYAYNSIDFSSNGVYTLLYSFTEGDKTLIAEKEVSVQDKIYKPFNGSSTVSYGELEKLKGEGINLTLSAGDTFTFNKPINVYESDLVNIITLYPEMIIDYDKYAGGDQTIIGADCLDFMVSLTDAYDPTNVVVMKMGFRSTRSGGVTTQVSSEHGRVSMVEYIPNFDGTHSKQYGQLTIGSKSYYIWRATQLTDSENRYGFSCGAYVRNGFSWQFGGTSNQIILQNASNDNSNVLEDLDSPDITTVSGTFRPFTTGEVYVSIYGERWQSSSTKIQIKQIGNYVGQELIGDYVIDDKAPTVSVDVDMQGKDSLVGVVYSPIKVFNAKAFDLNGASIKTSVYFNYGTDKQTSVNVVNGAFTPTVPGKYAIEYVVSDNYGNKQSKIIPVTVIRPNDTLSTSGEGIDILNVDEITLDSLVIGEKALLAEPEFLGYNGAINFKKSVVAPDGSVVAINGDAFLPTMLGNYTVNYNYFDNVFNYTYTYQVNCVASNDAFFGVEPNLQKYFILGATYKLDDYHASYVENGDIKTAIADLYVKYDGGEFIPVDYNNLKIDADPTTDEIEKAQTITFKYVYGTVETAGFERIIVDVNYKVKHTSGASLYQPDKYFYGDFSAAGAGLAQRYVSSVNKGNNKLEFINPILTDEFSFNYKIPEEMLNYKEIVFTLTDVNDPNNTVSIKQYFETWHSYVQFENLPRVDTTIIVNKDMERFDNATEKRITYSASSNKFTFNNGKANSDFFVEKEVPKFAYFTIEFVGITGEVGIDALLINGESLVLDKDLSKPIYLVNAASGYYNYGSEVVLEAPIVSDLFSPVSVKDVKVTVKDASGSYVRSVDGILLNNAPGYVNYTVQVTSDSYKVDYSGLVDDYGNTSQTTYSFYVADFEKPVITFDDGSNEDTVVETSVGKEITIKEFTITDNKSSSEDIQVVVTIVNLNYYNWVAKIDLATMKYKTVRKGNYKVVVSARDGAGNFQTAYYQLIVK